MTVLQASAGAGATGRISELRDQQATSATRARSAVLSLYALDTRLARARAELTSVRAEAARVERGRARVAHELSVARSVLRISQSRLAARLRSLYENGRPDAIAVLLGAASLSDAISRLDDMERTAHLDQQAVSDSTSARGRLVVLAAELSRRAAKLRALSAQAAQTAASLAAARTERLRYVASLRSGQQLRAREIARLSATASMGAQRSTAFESQVPTAAEPAPTVAPVAAEGTLTVTATGYAIAGSTSAGLPVGWGVVAVDPSVIPLGTRLSIPGYGEGVAADTGGGVRGATIDLWFPTQAQARAWGRRLVTITLH